MVMYTSGGEELDSAAKEHITGCAVFRLGAAPLPNAAASTFSALTQQVT
jgi:hypothetical protein